MARTIYRSNGVTIEFEKKNDNEVKVNCNGENLILIDSSYQYEFERELNELLEKYRIFELNQHE